MGDTNTLTLAIWLATWMVALAAIVIWQWRRGANGVGLVIAYGLNLWLIHWLATALYLLPWYSNFEPTDVFAGFKQSTYAILALGVGSMVIAPPLMRFLQFPPKRKTLVEPDERLSTACLVVGIVCYYFATFLGALPSVTAVISSGFNVVVVGLVLKCWGSWKRGRRRLMRRWAVVAMSLPFITVITQGFIGYGTVAALSVFAFITSFYRPRWKLVIIGLLIGYLGLSLYVTYLRDRQDIRDVVWGGQSYRARFTRMYDTLSAPELFDPSNDEHLHRVDDRLNQNNLVGASIRNLESGNGDFARGDTILQALTALIPRVIWWNKPIKAGSGNLVSDYTGMQFDPGTSVGIGQVMELYINFGTAGVVGGFLVLGILVAFFDAAAATRLKEGNWQAFAFWFLGGLAFMQAGGQLVEISMSAAGAMVLAMLTTRYIVPHMRGRRLISVSAQPRTSLTVVGRYSGD